MPPRAAVSGPRRTEWCDAFTRQLGLPGARATCARRCLPASIHSHFPVAEVVSCRGSSAWPTSRVRQPAYPEQRRRDHRLHAESLFTSRHPCTTRASLDNNASILDVAAVLIEVVSCRGSGARPTSGSFTSPLIRAAAQRASTPCRLSPARAFPARLALPWAATLPSVVKLPSLSGKATTVVNFHRDKRHSTEKYSYYEMLCCVSDIWRPAGWRLHFVRLRSLSTARV